MQKILTLKYMRGLRGPQKVKTQWHDMKDIGTKLRLLYFKEDPSNLQWAGYDEIHMSLWYSN